MEGKLLNNRYEIRKIIGTGGMAIVYDGYDNVLSREVAIKILKDNYADNEEFTDKLQMEAQASASISDENIVSIYDAASTVIDGKTVEYIVMEKVVGKTLKEVINEEAPLSRDRIIDYALQISKALQTAHRRGLVHRDIKPANILITKDDVVKVVDFGIARVATDATLTYTSSILGTVHYISPEQAKGQMIDERSDLYSLGVVLYEMATGKIPFDGESPVSIAVKHIQEKPEEVINLNPEIGEDLSNIIKKLLEKKPEDRYKTASNLLIDLNRIKSGYKINLANDETVKMSAISTDTGKQKVSYTKSKIEEIKEEKKPKKGLIYSLSILGLVLLIFFAYKISDYFIKRNENLDYVTMPSLIDIKEDVALTKIEELGLIGQINERIFDDNIIEGNVIEQSVASEKRIKKGTLVNLTISKGKEMIKIPNLKGYDAQNIEKILKDRGLEIGGVTTTPSELPKNQIINQVPEADEYIAKGSKINIVVSDGSKNEKDNEKETTTVPNLVGFSYENIEDFIKDRDFELGSQTWEKSNLEKNKIIKQIPEAGESVKKGTKINIIISDGPEEEKEHKVTVPNVEGLNQNLAITTIRNANLKPGKILKQHSDTVPEGDVIQQSTPAGSEVDKGTTIDITISIGREEVKETPKETETENEKEKEKED